MRNDDGLAVEMELHLGLDEVAGHEPGTPQQWKHWMMVARWRWVTTAAKAKKPAKLATGEWASAEGKCRCDCLIVPISIHLFAHLSIS